MTQMKVMFIDLIAGTQMVKELTIQPLPVIKMTVLKLTLLDVIASS